MRLQIWIIAGAFIIFGAIAWLATGKYSPSYIGLMAMGVVGLALGFLSGK